MESKVTPIGRDRGFPNEQPPQIAPPPDSLSDALIYLAGHYGRAVSRHALLASLPIEDGRLTVSLLSRAAERAGLEVEPIKRPLTEISALVCPVILTQRDGTMLIAVRLDQDSKTAVIINPSYKLPAETRTFADLGREYLGFAILVRPVAIDDARSSSTGELPKAHWFWSIARKFWPNYVHIAIAALVINILALASPLFIMNVYDRVVPNGAIPSLIALAVGLGIAIVFDFVLRLVRSQIIDMTGKKLDVVMAANIFEHVMSVKMAQRPTSVGFLASQMRDFDSVREFFTSGTVVSIIDLLFAVLFIWVLFFIAGPLAWIPLVMLPLMIIVGFILQIPLDRAMKRLQAESSARHGVLIESLNGIETVRAVGAEARMQSAWERSVAATARSGEDVHYWSSMALTTASTAQQLTSLALIGLGVFLILDGKLSMGALVAANMLAGRVLAPIAGIAAVITRATQAAISLKAMNRVMSLERERPSGRSYVARQIERGHVAFRNVTFKYPQAATTALDKVSFQIQPGERVGIIGRVGSGKTTVGRLLTQFYDPAEGQILVDGIDARQYDPADLRAGVGFVLQDVDLFFGKLRDNIALGKPDATDEEILAAARLAGVETFIAGHPLGYDMMVSEGGRSLSGGQKQAIGLARILLRKPKILFLDEPTAHFDTRSENEFLERLKAIATDEMTIIVSTHRPSLLNLVTRLLVFDQGRLVQDGPRDKVIEWLRGGAAAPAPGPRPAGVATASGLRANG